MWVVVSLFVVVYASLTTGYQYKVVPIATETFYKPGVKHERVTYKVVPAISDRKTYDLHNIQQGNHGVHKRLYPNVNYNYKLQPHVINHVQGKNLRSHHLLRENKPLEEYLYHYPSRNTRIQNDRNVRHFAPSAQSSYQNYKGVKCLHCVSKHRNKQNVIRTRITSVVNAAPNPDFPEAHGNNLKPNIITNKPATAPNPGTSKYINSIKQKNAQQGINTRTIWRSIVDGGPDPDSPEAQGKNPTPTITNEAATGPDPGTSEYINSIIQQNVQQGINTRTIWRSIVDGGPDPDSPEAQGKNPTTTITNEAATRPDPGTSDYINSIIKQNAQQGIKTRTMWRLVVDGGPDPDSPEAKGNNPTPTIINEAATGPNPDSPEAQGKNPTPSITNEAATRPDPGTSENINSIIKQNAQQGINTRTIWRSIVDGSPDPDSPKAQGKNPTPNITNEAATGPDPGTSEYINSIIKQNVQQGINTRTIWRSIVDGGPDPDSPEAQGKNPTTTITNEAATRPDPGTSDYINSIIKQNAQQGIKTRTMWRLVVDGGPDPDSPEAKGNNPTPTIINEAATGPNPDSPEAQGKNPTPSITNEAATRPDPGTSENINSIIKQNAQQGINTRTIWRSIVDGSPDPDSPEAQGKNPTPNITNEAATGPDPGTSEYINSIIKQNAQLGINTRTIWRSIVDGGPDPDTEEAKNSPKIEPITNEAATGPDPGTSEYINSIIQQNAQQGINTRTIWRPVVDVGPDPYSPKAQGKNPTPTITNEAATGPDPGTSENINSIIKQNSQQGIKTRTIWRSIVDGGPDPDTEEAKNSPKIEPITNEAATGPDPGTSEYINSIIQQNAQQGINTRTIWRPVVDVGPDPYSPRAQGKNPTPTITNEAATGPDPGISEYINSIIKQNAQQGINTRTIWRSIVDGGPDPDTEEAKNSPKIEPITNEAATGPDPGTSEYINSIINQNAQQGINTRTIWRSVVDGGPDPDSPEAQGKNPTPTITNEAATGPDPGTSQYINSIIKQNAQQGINTRTIWRSIVDGGPDPDSPEAQGKNPTPTITNEAATGPDPGTSEYINSIIKQNAQQGINTRTIWRSIVDGGPDPDTEEAKNSPKIEPITNEAATGPDPGTSEYINSIIQQNAQQGINTRTIWKPVVNMGLDPDSPKAQGKNPTPTITNEAATEPDPGTSDYINSISDQNAQQGINTRTIWRSVVDGGPDPDSPEAQGKNPTPTITNEAATGPDPGTSEYINSIIKQNALQGIKTRTIWRSVVDGGPDPDSPEAQGKNPTPTITNDAATGPDPGTSEYINSIIKQNAQQGINTRTIWRSILDGGPDPDSEEAKNSPKIEPITNEAATGPDPGTSEYINSIIQQNAQQGINTRTIWRPVVDVGPDPYSPKAQGKNPTLTITNEAATGPDPGTSDYINSIIKQNAQQGINTRTIWRLVVDGGPDPDSPEAQGNNPTPTFINEAANGPDPDSPKAQGRNPTQTITNKTATRPDPGKSEYINSIIKQNAQQGINTRTIWKSVVDGGTDPDFPEAQRKNPTPTITNETATRTDPGTSEYINSIIKQYAQQGIHTRKTWRSVIDGGPDPDSPEAQGNNPTPTITHGAATGPDPGTSEYINSIIKHIVQQGINTRTIWGSVVDGGPDPDSPEAQIKNPADIDDDAIYVPDLSTSWHSRCYNIVLKNK